MRVKRIKYIFAGVVLASAFVLPPFLSACGSAAEKDIYILFTGDVHCADDENIGYAGLAAYKESLGKRADYVTLVDLGDAVQGNYIGAVTKGSYAIELMNRAGYDYAVLGNHEFDYGMERLGELMENAHARYLGCNISYTGGRENALAALKPYEIADYGDTRVAFIGVTTPYSIGDSTPAYFMEDGGFVYDFCGGSNGENLYAAVQKNIDECRASGADHVILLTHLGDGEEYSPYSSAELIAATAGASAVLDGHAHNVIPCRMTTDKNGEEVLLASTGTGLKNIGQLILTPSGNVSVSLVSGYAKKDAKISAYIGEANAAYETALLQKVAYGNFGLSVYGKDGARLVRNRETPIGNLCADAYRAASGADVAFVNGGGIRAGLAAGEITYEDVLAVQPFANTLCMVKATGREIADALEFSCKNVRNVPSENGAAVGENGGFLQVSGLRFTVDTSLPSSVLADENGMFLGVEGARRVKEILVLNADGRYVPLEEDREYTVASHNYTLKNAGDGYTMFTDNEFLIGEGIFDYQALLAYVTENLGGVIGDRYASPEGRIAIK